MEQNGNKDNETSDRPQRRCLSCGRHFAANGPFIRLCGPCKSGEEWLTGEGDFSLRLGSAANDN